MYKLSELEKIKYELEREYENIDLLISNMQSIYDELFDKFKQELPKSWKISFIEEEDNRLSYFEIYDDINGNIENHTIRYKGVIYNLIGNKNSKNTINKIIDNYFNNLKKEI